MTNELDTIAKTFMETFLTDEMLAEKEAAASLLALAEGDESVYLGLRNELSNKIRILLENELFLESEKARREYEEAQEAEPVEYDAE